MIVVGIDPHKRTHTAVAIDARGRRLAQQTVPARADGHQQLLGWARRLDGERTWAVEDCRGVTSRLETDLLAAGERVVRVPAHLTGPARGSLRQRGKSDPIDALAVARVALAEPDLPVAQHDQASLEVKLLVDHREDLIAQRTQLVCRLRWHLHQLAPELDIPSRLLHTPYQLDRIAGHLAGLDDGGVRARICADLLAQIQQLSACILQLEEELADRVQRLAPRLLTLQGVGVVTAAKLLGETANPTRFATADKFVMHTGTAPIPVSSGQRSRHRLNRGGNRQLNAALHRIALTQTRLSGPGQVYYQRKLADGKTRLEAMRCLKRHLARVVFHLMLTDYHTRTKLRPAAA